MTLTATRWVQAQSINAKIYAIFSGTSKADALKRYFECSEESHSVRGLYNNTPYQEWHAVMPYLAEISPDSPFLKWINQTSFTDWGWLASSPHDMSEVYRQLNRLTKVILPDEKEVFFRYWDGDFLPKILDASTSAEQTELLGVFSSLWINRKRINLLGIIPSKDLPLITLTEQQLSHLKQQAKTTFEIDLLTHLKQTYPKHVRIIGAANCNLFIDQVVNRCQFYKIDRFSLATQYLDLMMVLGSYFDTDPLLIDRISPYLAKLSESDSTCLYELNDVLAHDFRKSMGENLIFYKQALNKLRLFSPNNIPTSLVTDSDVVPFVYNLYPERAQLIEIDQLHNVFNQNFDFYKEQNINLPNGKALILALQFFLGTGVLHDPLYGWLKIKLDQSFWYLEPERFSMLLSYAQHRARKELILLNQYKDAS